ncbi:MAG: tRNA (adenosine(37)-N6)-threonylcarbamoyltransferase complex dimerization subunit type 1 TsaB [Pseudomonadota bacterium]
MGLLLAIDTAGPVVGAALVRGEVLEGAWCARVGRGAEARLTPAIAELLQGRRPEVLAVAVGPGAFTGLRVGVATALGLATALGVPVVPVPSLQARAAMAAGEPRVLALLDARKERFYGGLYDARPPLPVALGPERDLPLEELLAVAPAVAVGEGAGVVRAACLAAGHRVVPHADRNPAVYLACVARLLYAGGCHVAADVLQIRYLRPPDATPPTDLPRSAIPSER